MTSHQWKNIIDGLDEDIVNSAAERFGKARYSDDDPTSYPADDHPKEYRYTVKKGSSRRRLTARLCAAGGAAAAVVAGVFILRGQLITPNVTQPLSDMSSEQVSDTPVIYIENKPESSDTVTGAIKTDGFSIEVFEKYFYGSWVSKDGNGLEFSYSPNELFNHFAGRTVVRMESNSEGGFMLAQGDYGYDLLYVSAEHRDTLYYYRNFALDEAVLADLLLDIVAPESGYNEVYTRDGSPDEGDRLGYFGVEKLACEMGISAEKLITQDIQFEGGDGELWTNMSIAESRYTVFLMGQTEDSVSLRMKYRNYTISDTAFFDVTFERNGDDWAMNSAKSVTALKFRTGDDGFEGVTVSALALYDDHFYDWWYSDSDEYPSIVLNYKEDVFTPAEYCMGIEEEADGWAMYKQTAGGIKVYYIPDNNSQFMYLYSPDENGFVEPNDCDAVYERVGGSMGFAGSNRVSLIGLERYKLRHSNMSEGISLGSAIGNALNEAYDETWHSAYYTSDMEGWDGYRISEISESEVLFYFQQFNHDGQSRWACQQLVREGTDWTAGDLTVNITADELEIAGSYGEMIPVDYSVDLAAEESAGAVDGR